MLTLNLAELYRRGSLEIDGDIEPDDPIWKGGEIELLAPVHVRARATPVASGEIWVQGRLATTVAGECRRCLDPVEVKVQEALELLFVPSDEREGGAEGDAEARVLDLNAQEVDLTEPVREELLLAVPRYVVCEADCRGLCPRCGANRNRESCECTFDEPDPRWDKLRAMLEE